ncbi:sugar transferase [Clavibacter michiganensis]|uniref:sugar transferase n=1 Tax=Clavibacter michiganensis TaxID=28447 RepID=UPI000B39CECD|nr:sugar transferase [Clavibacter michiganensis]MDO4030822.1 sugar transferase [Clavibacter michiganensis]MDO4080002.1 sugar transferase [Clavibacter michiganensis]MDO4086354.1 sugar transferase [Clavibacter michiganensis]MDO4095342.1 sugar transferase [Clavibacter michiganensis]MDO4136056.1 sugar transferase [Clavibacter michiganensis]
MIEQKTTHDTAARETGARRRITDRSAKGLRADAGPLTEADGLRAHDWRRTYAVGLVVTDLLVLIWVVFGVQIAWFGFETSDVAFNGDYEGVAVSYSLISLVIIASWMVALGLYGTRGYRVLGTGPQEYRLILDATVRLFGLLAIVAFLGRIDFARGYIIIALPLGLVTLVLSRWMWRQWLNVQRAKGRYSSRVLLIGSEASTGFLARELARQPYAGYHVVGACIPSGVIAATLPGTGIPVLGKLADLQAAMRAVDADTIVIASNDELSPERIRELSWSLEPGRQHLVVAPSLTDIGGPRIHTRPVAGLPLIHVETPRYEGTKLFAKRAFDIVASTLILVLASPLFLAIAITIRLSTPGPVLFRQERVGIDGRPFQMLKFRTMVTDAEARLLELEKQSRDAGNSVLFKMKDDPRVTPIGRFLRRYSLDELMQLVNVLNGSMSLVGPRPPLAREVEAYETKVHRRFLVKPGITGLWQVSGRSNLSWEDSVRLDLYYVENWSIVGDLVILWKTAKAVLAREGAY